LAGQAEGSIEHSHVPARTRVIVAFAAGVVAFGIAMFLTSWEVATLTGWNVAAIVYIAWVWLGVGRSGSAATARLAAIEDESRPTADLILILASGASLIGVAVALVQATSEAGFAKDVITAIALLTVVLSWGAVHTVFTLRYANLYYLQGGGIDFNDERQPDYGDFAYVAFTIGMTYQVSDTSLTSKQIRSTALHHAYLSYVFGTGVVAMFINVVAGLFRA
jgi:uncharacterized membrane protein